MANTKKKPKKEIRDDFQLQTNDPEDSVYEIRVTIDEKLKSKVICQDNLQYVLDNIQFDYYIESKNTIRLVGKDIGLLRGVAYILESLAGAYRKLGNTENEDLIDDLLDELLDEVLKESGEQNFQYSPDAIIKDVKGRFIVPRTNNQDRLVESIRENVITIARGVAGSGKSSIAVAMAVTYLLQNRYDKILIVRPMTSVGGKDVGFLPGNLDEKFGPYASPLIENIIDLVGEPKYNEWVRGKKIILTPTSFVRGANFKNSLVIIDEAQNLSEIEIFTLLTRICHNGKVIITGDESQDDRKDKKYNDSGLQLFV
jgi:phosphate starvation-inducible PhoH-like protein